MNIKDVTKNLFPNKVTNKEKDSLFYLIPSYYLHGAVKENSVVMKKFAGGCSLFEMLETYATLLFDAFFSDYLKENVIKLFSSFVVNYRLNISSNVLLKEEIDLYGNFIRRTYS